MLYESVTYVLCQSYHWRIFQAILFYKSMHAFRLVHCSWPRYSWQYLLYEVSILRSVFYYTTRHTMASTERTERTKPGYIVLPSQLAKRGPTAASTLESLKWKSRRSGNASTRNPRNVSSATGLCPSSDENLFSKRYPTDQVPQAQWTPPD